MHESFSALEAYVNEVSDNVALDHYRPPLSLVQALLADSAARHRHQCPRQVLGIRFGLLGLRLLGFGDEGRFVNDSKRLLTFAETDGCGADGIAVATDCWVGRRTLRIVDHGKMAATLVDTLDGRAVRIAPHPEARTAVHQFAPEAPDRWHAYLAGYQVMPDSQLLVAQTVTLQRSVAAILSRPEARVICDACGEEVRNEREVQDGQRILCRGCAGDRYYDVVS